MMPNDRFGNVYWIAVNSPPRKPENAAFAQARFVRIADIDVHRTEGLLCSLSFESERYSPQAYNGDDIAF